MDVRLNEHEQALVDKADHYARLAERLRGIAWDHYVARHGTAYVIVSAFGLPEPSPAAWLN